MYRLLKERMKTLKPAMIRFAQELVRIPSTTLQEGNVADRVEREMTTLGYDEVARDEAGNVVGVLFGMEGPEALVLNSHMDTVDVGESDAWRKDPHGGDTDTGYLHGLGAADCKGGVASHVYAGALLKNSLLPLDRTLVVAATVAEANGESIGVRRLIEHTLPALGITPDYCLLGEPTNLRLYYGHDGWIELEIKVKGSNPFSVDDAAEGIYRGLDSETGSGDRGRPEFLAVSRPRFLQTGCGREATIDMVHRIRENETAGEVITSVQKSAALTSGTAGSLAVQVDVKQESGRLYTGRTALMRHVTNAWATDPFSPLIERSRQSLSAAGLDARPGKWKLGRLGMGTAGSVLTGEYGIPTVGFGPGAEDHAHAPNERVSLRNLERGAYGTASIAHGLVGIPVYGWTADGI